MSPSTVVATQQGRKGIAWKIGLFVLSLLLCFGSTHSFAAQTKQQRLQQTLSDMVSAFAGTVGIAVCLPDDKVVLVNNEQRYPLFSVMKFHQAVALLDYIAQKNLSLDSRVTVSAAELQGQGYSPFAQHYPDGKITSLRELLSYTLVLSDNKICDILFTRFVNPKETERFIHRLGSKDFALRVTEKEQTKDLVRSTENWTTPLAAAKLMKLFWTSTHHFRSVEHAFVKQLLLSCRTGRDRLDKGLTGTAALLAHKTGTGPYEQGKLVACNDLGVVLLPDGKIYSVAVFVKNAEHSLQEAEALIARISQTIYEAVSQF